MRGVRRRVWELELIDQRVKLGLGLGQVRGLDDNLAFIHHGRGFKLGTATKEVHLTKKKLKAQKSSAELSKAQLQAGRPRHLYWWHLDWPRTRL